VILVSLAFFLQPIDDQAGVRNNGVDKHGLNKFVANFGVPLWLEVRIRSL
jgi:hypothetical protein